MCSKNKWLNGNEVTVKHCICMYTTLHSWHTLLNDAFHLKMLKYMRDMYIGKPLTLQRLEETFNET